MHTPDTAVALTEAQEGLWYAQRLDPANPVFNTGHCTRIRGHIDADRFAQAIDQTLREADALRLAFVDTEHGPKQYFDAARMPRIERFVFDDTPEAHRTFRQIIEADLRTPVDPVTMPLARQMLFSIGDALHFWYQRVHHLAADGYGMALIEQRAVQCYHALISGQPTGKALSSFEVVIEDDLRYRNSETRERDGLYWRESLGKLDAVASLSDASALTGDHVLMARRRAPESLSPLLQQREQRIQCSWPDIITTLAAAYVQRHTGQRPVVVGVPWMGRMGTASARSVATVMNIVPLILEIDQDRPLDELIIDASRELRRTRRHGRYRSEQMRRDLGMPGGQGRIHGPLINILPFDAPYAQAGLDAEQEVLSTGPVEDFTLNARAAFDGSDMRIEIEANPRLYTQQEVDAHLDRFIAFMQAALSSDRLRPVQTLHGDEYRHWVYGVNQTTTEVPDTTLVALVQEVCTRLPDNEALRMGNESISFAQFDRSITQAAHRLCAAGVIQGSIVAVALPRSTRMVMSLHAIQKAGAAYLPLDIEQPVERIRRILNAAQPRACVGDDESLQMLLAATSDVSMSGRSPTCLAIETLFDDAPASSVHAAGSIHAAGSAHAAGSSDASGSSDAAGSVNAARSVSATGPVGAADAIDTQTLPSVQPTDPAYVIYTSGSTGEPKGVVINHRAIVNRLLWMRSHYGFQPSNRFLQKTPYTFDVSVWELFLPMLTGAPLVIAEPGAHRDPQALARLIRQEAIDVVHFVPSMLAAFLDDPGSEGLEMHSVFCSGEALPARLRNQFHARMKGALHNLYGPTEAAVDVSWWEASTDDASDPVPIGFPVWNTQLLILDDCLRPVAPGVTGTLYLGGRQLADGYLGRPDLTAERFIPDPFSDRPDARLYDTDDLARWRPDGAVEYQGRIDHQVKLRGQRIELGEIESVLSQHPLCRQLAVIPQSDANAQVRLVAYVVPHQPVTDQEAAASELLDHAQRHLPAVMLPSAFVFLAELPINVNGKLDRKKLPVPAFAAHSSRPASTPTEIRVADTMQQVLGLKARPGADDDFFALGGHSLLATRLAALLRHNTGSALTLGALFEHPVVSRLASWIDTLKEDAAQAERAGFGPLFMLREAPGANDPAPKAGTEAPLFCIHPAGGLAWCYGALARKLSGQRAVIGLQSPALLGQHHSYATLKQLAGHYADEILALAPRGPLHLLGWSTGGILVQEIACQLQARGHQPGVVCLLDAYPAEAWRDRAPPEARDAYRAILHIAGYDPNTLPDLAFERDSVIGFLRQKGHPLGDLTDAQLHGIFDAVAFSNALVRPHRHTRYGGQLLYMRAARDHVGENRHPDMWRPWAGTLTVHDIPCLHAHLPGEEALAHWLPPLEAALAEIDNIDGQRTGTSLASSARQQGMRASRPDHRQDPEQA